MIGKNHWFALRANLWPQGNAFLFCSSQHSLASVLDPWRAFWADTAPFKGPRLASCVASGTTEIQGDRQVCRTRCRNPRTLSKTVNANLDYAFVENALFTQILNCVESIEKKCVNDQTCPLPTYLPYCVDAHESMSVMTYYSNKKAGKPSPVPNTGRPLKVWKAFLNVASFIILEVPRYLEGKTICGFNTKGRLFSSLSLKRGTFVSLGTVHNGYTYCV